MPGPPVDAGRFLLAPSWNSVEGFARSEERTPPFVFTGAWMEVPGPEQSLIRTLTRQRLLMPNAFVVPIGAGARATEGEIVLTSRSTGSGLSRAIVVPGGSPEAPRVRYLGDPRGSDPAPDEDRLEPDTFRRLNDGDLGTTVACLEQGRRVARILVGRSGDRLLGLGFGGVLALRDTAACEAVPLIPRADIGARVRVPVVGVYRLGKVVRKESGAGCIWVSYDFAGAQSEAAFAFGDVIDESAER